MSGTRVNLFTLICVFFLYPFSITLAGQALDCSGAYASKEILFDPNNKMQNVKIKGIQGAKSITIQCIDQDEPVATADSKQSNGGKKNTKSFDASGIGKSQAKIRKQRAHEGNGRVYHIDFLASDKKGGQCSGTVKVSVPLSRDSQSVDDGRLFSSTGDAETCHGNSQNTSPIINSSPVKSVLIGEHYLYQVEAIDNDGDSLSYSFAVSPSGMTIGKDSGLILWQPTEEQSGIHNVVLVVSDEKGATTDQVFEIDVTIRNQIPEIYSSPKTTATEGQTYSYQVLASDNDGDQLNYQLVQSPKMMTIDTFGLVEWAPGFTDSGSYAVSIEVSDSHGASATQEFLLVVTNANQAPTALSKTFETDNATTLDLTLEANDLDGDPLTYSLVSNPLNGVLTGAGNQFTYSPNKEFSGTDSFEFIVNDGQSDSPIATIHIIVSNQNSAPVITVSTPEVESSFVQGEIVTFSANAIDEEDGDISNSISWLSNLDGLLGEGKIIEKSLSIGEHIITAKAIDSQNEISSISFNVTVLEEDISQNISIERLSAEPTIINEGESTVLRWFVEGADQIELSPGIGFVASNGSIAVSPLTTTTYVLTASAGGVQRTTSITIEVLAPNTTDLFLIDYPLADSYSDSQVFQVVGTYFESNNQVFYNNIEACNVGNQFVLTNIPFDESEEEAYEIAVLLNKPNTTTYSKSVQVNRAPTPHAINLIPDTSCAIGPGTIGFQLSGIDQPVARIQFDINGDGIFDGTADENLTFSHTFEASGVYLIKAHVEYASGIEHVVEVAIGVRNGVQDTAFYNHRWNEFISALSQGDSATALNFFHDQSRAKYSDILGQLGSSFQNLNNETSGLESVATTNNHREFVFLHVLDDQPQVFTITFNGGKIVGI